MYQYNWKDSRQQCLKKLPKTDKNGLFKIKKLEDNIYTIYTTYNAHDHYMGFPEPSNLLQIMALLRRSKIPYTLDSETAYTYRDRDNTRQGCQIEISRKSWELMKTHKLR